MPILRAFNRRLLRPWANEARRFLAGQLRLPLTITVDRLGEFRFRVQNTTELGRTLDYGHEMGSLAAFLFLLTPEDIVWDIGASVGLFSVHSAARTAKVVAFEPDPPTLARLKENVDLNRLGDRVMLRGCAVGEARGTLELASDGLHGFAPALATGQLGRHRATVSVPVETIDELVAAGIPAPTVVKIDIEGAEILALKGGAKVLSGPGRPRLIFIEMHPHFLPNFGSSAEETERLLISYGYRLLSTQKRAEQYHLIAGATS